MNAAGAIPRAHRFLAVESTSDVEQPSPFAGRRSVGALRSVRILERALQPCIRDPIDDMRCSEGERGRAHIDVALRRPRRSVTCARPFGPCGVLAALRKKGGPGLRAGRHHAARSFALQVFERGSATRGNAGWNPTLASEDRTLENVPVRRSLKVCCRSRRAVPGLRSLLALSAGRCTRPSAHRASALRVKRRKTGRKTRGTKGSWRTEGCEWARGRGARYEYFGVHRTRETASVELARAGRRARSRRLVRGWLLLLAPADTSRRRKPPGREETPCDGRRLGSSPAGRFHDRTVTASSACTRFIDTHAKARAGGHVKATETSEVGPHRAPRVNSPEGKLEGSAEAGSPS